MPDATKTSENLLIRPTKARQLLGGTSPAFFWKTILPQLRSFRLGRARWIEMKSVHEFIARQLAGAPQEQARVDRRGRSCRCEFAGSHVYLSREPG